ncbi:uncharacterized protein N7515_003446 [Penicillium bovifimosum]|uniref:Uncharacterized protein n=1 Tax=Penicillium bovifimosum TaxID=126998 RepID=A0A9W9L4N8_9EURO|nr:uncharacterized protein N7515_003446 [Penicillium bovifimosum]KAJ5138598.1 hypothetical protein N7515_003446 [Penicillium bovifimosum]
MENQPPSPQAQPSDRANPLTESSFSFTPIKALKALPRLWDRKPSTPIRGADKSRKLWKRIRFPFTGMNTATGGAATAIGVSRNSDYQRGVKRRCVDPADANHETEPEQRGWSFLETKWEMQASRKKRKMPEFDFNIHEDRSQEMFGFTANQPTDVVTDASTNLCQPLGLIQTPEMLVDNDATVTDVDITTPDAKTTEDPESTQSSHDASATSNATEGLIQVVVPTAGPAQDLTQEQEVKLVRSALRSSLDGEDAELLNDFLSKAKAKRAAKSMDSEDAEAMDVSSGSPSSEESPEVECSTPRSRRALEELNTNSPSPVKLHISPSKYDVERGAERTNDQETIIPKEIKEEAPPNPARRRSSRTKDSSAPNARNTISLRRAKGTEFIFLQRTEAQQIALATKRNTRLNKGKSVAPNVALEALAQQASEEARQSSSEPNESSRNRTSLRGLTKPRKQVTWNEERMAEYEEYEVMEDQEAEEEGDQCTDDVGATPRRPAESKRSAKKDESSQRSSRSQTQKADEQADNGGPTAPVAAATAAAPRSRRVRRLGDSGIMGSGTPVKPGSRSTSKPPAASAPAEAQGPSTPTKGRRKLAPKSPRLSKLPAPASKSAGNKDQQFVSGIPTRNTAADDVQRKSMLQMSAGCTPTARRVRSRS